MTDSSVIKASNIYYWDLDQPERLYQIAEEYYQKAQECQKGYSYQKAKVYYQKAEECYQRVREVYQAKKQAGEAKKLADEAKRQADEVCALQKTFRRTCKSQPAADHQDHSASSLVYLQPLMRQQYPDSESLTPKPSPAATQKPRSNQEDKATPQKAVKQSVKCADELIPQQPSAIQDTPDSFEKKVHRPISWKGKRHS